MYRLPSYDERGALVKAAYSMASEMGRYPHRYKVLQYNANTAPICDLLREWGFFAFHSTNKGQLISLIRLRDIIQDIPGQCNDGTISINRD